MTSEYRDCCVTGYKPKYSAAYNNHTDIMLTDSIIEKSVLAVAQLCGHGNWGIWSVSIAIALGKMWGYVKGIKSSPPAKTSNDYSTWVTENCYAHQRIWLTLSDDIKQAIFPHAHSHASKLYSALKAQYEPRGAIAEFHTRCNYENVKLPDHDNFDGFMTAMINAAYQFNKEISNTNAHINNCDIAMRIIHNLLSPMYMLQTILFEGVPASDKTSWDLDDLRQCITTAEIHAQAASLKLGTKLDAITELKALMAQDNHHRGRKIDPTWASQQTCWHCGRISHIHQKCTMSQAEKQAY